MKLLPTSLRRWGAVLGLLLALAPGGRAQLVNDGETNVLDGVTNVVAGDVIIGTNGSFTRLVLTNGAVLTNSGGNSYVGYNVGANSNEVLITGVGSQWFVGGSLSAGYSGQGNRVVVSNGGYLVTSASGGIGGISNEVLVTGAGSFWSNFSQCSLSGFGSKLFVSEGGGVFSGFCNIGTDGGENNELIVTGAASSLSVYAKLNLGGHTNRVLIADGGTASFTQCEFNYPSGFPVLVPTNNEFLVTGSGSSVNISFAFEMFGDGKIVVSNGAALKCANTVAYSGSIVITGAGSSWVNIGGAFGFSVGVNDYLPSLLAVSDAGLVSVDTKLEIGNSSAPRSRAVVNGGTMRATNASGSARLSVNAGTNEFDAGLMDIDQLLITASAGFFEFNGGTLLSKATTNANGRVFTVGNGASAALFQLQGGTHSFANGLVLASNATLTGSGSIVGNVTNFGTLAPGASAGSLALNGELRLRDSATLALEIGGVVPGTGHDFIAVSNLVEFGGALNVTLINGFTPSWSNRFTLLTCAGATGAFTNVASGGRLAVGTNGGTLRVVYDGGSLRAGDYRLDLDGDGVDDAWAQFYFGHSPLTPAEKAADADGDGKSNFEEYLAGTNPSDAQSVLGFLKLSVDATGKVTVQFQGWPDRAYLLEYADALGGWNPVSSPVLTFPSPGLAQWVDDGSLTGGLASARDYRVRVVP
ncbi:MAG: hypothetical protein HY301_13000 [Verrucomicrobia bacterium]|nr:hypothetical protein [Verrucomicrobiota bacterium]